MRPEMGKRRFTDDELVNVKHQCSRAITTAVMEIGDVLDMNTFERIGLATALSLSAVDHLTKVRS